MADCNLHYGPEVYFQDLGHFKISVFRDEIGIDRGEISYETETKTRFSKYENLDQNHVQTHQSKTFDRENPKIRDSLHLKNVYVLPRRVYSQITKTARIVTTHNFKRGGLEFVQNFRTVL